MSKAKEKSIKQPKKTRPRKKTKFWFNAFKKIMPIRYKRPEFIYLGEEKEVKNGSIMLSNHEGTDAPLSLELYLGKHVRMWGAHEMNSGVRKMYDYQTKVYYHEKKHWNLHFARLFCLLASPLTNLFYSGLDLISTYRDGRFLKTLRESTHALENGEIIVIFPEDSSNGYMDELEGFFAGFVALAETCYRRGMDLPIYVTYFRKKDLKYVIDAPVMYSTLVQSGLTREEIAKKLLDRCNELGKMQFPQPEKQSKK